MTRSERLAAILAETFAVDLSKIKPATTPDDIRKWDSIGHMKMVAALEEAFGVEFDVDEIMEMVSVERILSRLEAKGVPDAT